MNPMFHHGYSHFRRRPNRFLWFVIGGLATAWFIKRKEMRNDGERRFGHCKRAPIQPPQSLQPPIEGYEVSPMTARKSLPMPQNPQSWSIGERAREVQQQQQWEDDKARLLDIGRSAGDTVGHLRFLYFMNWVTLYCRWPNCPSKHSTLSFPL
jgi:hypothetical protein